MLSWKGRLRCPGPPRTHGWRNSCCLVELLPWASVEEVDEFVYQAIKGYRADAYHTGHLVRCEAFAGFPYFLQEIPRLPAGPPVPAEARLYVLAQLDLQCPGAKIPCRIKTVVQIEEELGLPRLELSGICLKVRVEAGRVFQIPVRVQSKLVDKFGGISPDRHELGKHRSFDKIGIILEAEHR